ncbi:uncharacterized protein CPUR_03767 [Claviceps purpurea 20.1]|uniref:Uncharacterized protein n=1 Tax=Claviceps purpurea (strain 20.1) TaxID=1111077 RepID=M1W5H9_CLAP2|nr:uncharacterized protein CPUR_03767 [Claviceps purpurea 20.1]
MPHGPTKFRSTVYIRAPAQTADSPDSSESEDDDAGQPADAPATPTTTTTTTQATQEHPAVVVTVHMQHTTAGPACFLTVKEKADFQLALELREAGKITTPGAPFEASDKTELDALMVRGVSKIITYDPVKHKKEKILRSREVKGKTTDEPYEKVTARYPRSQRRRQGSSPYPVTNHSARKPTRSHSPRTNAPRSI